MSGPAQSGLLIYAKHLEPLAHFYELLLGMTRIHSAADLVVLQSPQIQLVVHAIPPQIAETISIASPPQRREETPLKFFFTLPSLATAAAQAQTLGGEVFPEQWQGSSFLVRNACDPEGNIFQLRESIPEIPETTQR